MAENILEKIIKNKVNKINNLKKDISLDSLIDKIKKIESFINFKNAYNYTRNFIKSGAAFKYIKSLQNV